MNLLSLRTNIFQTLQNSLRSSTESRNLIQARYYAARKGTRERKRKAKVKVEVEKVGFIPHNQRNREKFLASRPKLKFDDSLRKDPIDDVYVCKYYKWVVYPFQEAVKCHKETHHPDMYNVPNADLNITIELNMEGEKKTRLLDNFTRIVGIPHSFNHKETRSLAVFCKSLEKQQLAIDAGAQLSGGVELIKQIQNGEIPMTDYKYVIAHPDILPELVVLRGLLKKRFPNPKNGSLDINLEAAINKFLHGINYTAAKDEYEKDYGSIQTVIGSLDMDAKHLEENFAELVKDVYLMKPKRQGTFISRCILWSAYSPERLKVDHNQYLENQQSNIEEEVEELEDRMTL